MAKRNFDCPFGRRSFLKLGSVGMATALGGAGGLSYAQEPASPNALPVQFRTLGRTKLKVSVVSVGAMRTSEPAVLQAAFDRGVNYVDTAHCYMGGKNERIVGEAIKGRRDKVYVATKFDVPAQRDAIIKSAEESLKSLGTDHIDVLQMHMPPVGTVLSDEAKEALADLRRQGKIRFTGVTTHSNQVEVVDAMIRDPDKFYDMVLIAYNFKSPPEHKRAIARAAEAGLGVVAMKTQAGGYQTKELGDISPHQAALKWVLQDTHIHAAVPAMVDLDQVREDTETMAHMTLTRAEHQVLGRYATAIAPYYCHRCNNCEDTCPKGVDIATVNRCLMYAEGYGDMALARATYKGLPPAASLASCRDCAACTAQCVHGLNLAARLDTARKLLV